ncbi:DNA topoisomerase IV subunit A [Deltaproteobacteria bacterium TL4]
MDQNFLEYASYVIKDRAIPDLNDGLKPVQRRILHTMMKMDDGKFNKVANIIGDSMKLHPHGDASIGSAIVVLANKEYFIDKQGNFGNILTGDPASAARYIEARLTPLAKEVLFNPEITEFIPSYDGRNQEPVTLPCKIPSVLLLGAEGIAVGMSTRILPHNFNEVLEAQIAYLQNQPFELYPDFLSGGLIDVSQYQEGGGKVNVRANIEVVDDKTLIVRDVPYGVTTETLIQSIQDAVNKGKFKLSSINDYTTDAVAIELKTVRGVNAEGVIPQLYAFTQCEVSISVNLLVIQDNQPVQIPTAQILRHSTDRLIKLLGLELELALAKTKKQWHHKQLEMFFISHKIYRDLEECESYEAVLETVSNAMKPLRRQLEEAITKDDLERLLTIQIKRLSKFDLNKSQEELTQLENTIQNYQNSLKDVNRYTIRYIKNLIKTYGKLYPRRTKISEFKPVNLKEVVVKDQKLGWDEKEGYIGTVIKAEQTILCTTYDRIVVFHTDGRYRVVKVPEKLFIGKDVIRVDKVDTGLIYNLIYYENREQICYAKRFSVEKFILDKEYRLFTEQEGAVIAHFSAGPGVMVEVQFVPKAKMQKARELFNFDDLAVKGVSARGNRVSTKPVKRVKIISKATNLEN